MKVAIFYYSGAGNTKFIAKKLKHQLEQKNYDVAMTRITQKTSVNHVIK